MTLFKGDGGVNEGFFKDDKLHGFGRVINSAGGYFIGECADDNPLYGKSV